jgi:hypothetical protein
VFSGIPLWDYSGNTGLCQLMPEVLRNAVRRFGKQVNILSKRQQVFLIPGRTRLMFEPPPKNWTNN